MSLANRMAVENPHVTAIAVEVSEYPDLARKYRVRGVPMTVVDNRVEIMGALPEDAFVAQAVQLRVTPS